MGEAHLSHQVLTLTAAVAAGGFLMVIARRFAVPSIVLLLVGGFVLGPEGWNIVQPNSLGSLLQVIVSLAVSLILFEGGLTLNVQGYRAMGATIRKLLSIGVVMTWLLTSALIWVFYRLDVSLCLLAGSLVIVTGPTVIQPILKRIRLKWNLHNILHWEGVLIDPIGVFVAVLCFEWAVVGGGEAALANLGLRLVAGAGIGVLGGELIYRLLRWIPEEMLNVYIVSGALLVFGVAEHVIAESGLLSVTLAGLVIGAHQPPQLKAIREFKAIITDLLIGLLFILLVARLRLDQFLDFGVKGMWLIIAFLLVVRPLVVLASTWGEGFRKREIAFLSWVAPRGVVAASMASLFALALGEATENARFIETFTYSVIVATVVLQGFSAAPLARLLRLQQQHPDGWLIVGAHPFGREIARFIREQTKVAVTLVDSNQSAVDDAQTEGLQAFQADAREVEAIERRPEMRAVGNLLAITDNEDLNELLCTRWAASFGKDYVYRWSSGKSGLMRHNGSGRRIWTWMPRPGVVSSELLLGDAALITIENAAVSLRGSITPVMLLNEGKLVVDPDPKLRVKAGKQPVHVLCLQRDRDPLMLALRPELVLRMDVEKREELFAKVARHASHILHVGKEDDIRKAVTEREEQMPSNIGHGVAIPHARLPGLHQMVCAIVQLARPLEWEGGDPVRIAFLVLSPESEPEAHLALLGEIARMMSDKATREEIVHAQNLPGIIQLIRERRNKQSIVH